MNRQRKFKFTLLDPTGVELYSHEIPYSGGWAQRIMLEIDDVTYMVRLDGENMMKISPDKPKEMEIDLTKVIIREPVIIREDRDVPTKNKNNETLQEELKSLEAWLKSDEGKDIIRKSQEKADEDAKIIDKLNDIDPELLRIPFGLIEPKTMKSTLRRRERKY